MLSDFPPHVQREIQRITDQAARRLLAAEIAKRDGVACVNCGGLSGAMRPISGSSPQTFAHADCAGLALA